jgi:TonB family protein
MAPADLPACETALVGVAPSNWSYEDALAALTELGWLNSSFTVVQLPTQPEVRNRRETGRALVRSYAAHLRDRGIGGQVNMLLWVDADGRPQEVQVVEKSQYPELDDAARYVTRVMRFQPAVYDNCRVPAAVLIPIVFRSSRALPPQK